MKYTFKNKIKHNGKGTQFHVANDPVSAGSTEDNR